MSRRKAEEEQNVLAADASMSTGSASSMMASKTTLEEQIGNSISTLSHGSVGSKDYGGLSSKAVWSLCVYLDCGNFLTKLLERISDLPDTSVERIVKYAEIRTQDVLKLYFHICRSSMQTDEEAIKQLLKILQELKLEGAVQIIQDDLNELDQAQEEERNVKSRTTKTTSSMASRTRHKPGIKPTKANSRNPKSYQEEFQKGFLTMVYGEVDPKNFGGLSEKAVWSLFDHLDDANRWTRLADKIYIGPGRSVGVAVNAGTVKTKGLLELHFGACRKTELSDKEAIESLVKLLEELKFERAVEIIREDLEK